MTLTINENETDSDGDDATLYMLLKTRLRVKVVQGQIKSEGRWRSDLFTCCLTLLYHLLQWATPVLHTHHVTSCCIFSTTLTLRCIFQASHVRQDNSPSFTQMHTFYCTSAYQHWHTILIQKFCPSVRPSVRLSIGPSVCHTPALYRNGLTDHHTFWLSAAYGSAISLIFPVLNIFVEFRQGVEYRSEYKFCNFWSVHGYIWETIQDRAIATTEW